jgi:hypothetical protein
MEQGNVRQPYDVFLVQRSGKTSTYARHGELGACVLTHDDGTRKADRFIVISRGRPVICENLRKQIRPVSPEKISRRPEQFRD